MRDISCLPLRNVRIFLPHPQPLLLLNEKLTIEFLLLDFESWCLANHVLFLDLELVLLDVLRFLTGFLDLDIQDCSGLAGIIAAVLRLKLFDFLITLIDNILEII